MSQASPHPGRVTRLRAALRHGGSGALLVTHRPNVRWLSGFTGSTGWMLVTAREAIFFTDFRYRAQSSREVRNARRVECAEGLVKAVTAETRRARVRRLAFEAEQLTFAAHADLAAGLSGVELVPLRGAVERLRAVKDAGEIGAIQRALSAARRAFADVVPGLVGRSEREIAEELRARLRAAGADGEAFPSIVASGLHAALPHAAPTRRRIGAGDIVVMDFGASVAGYHCDLTRTLRIGGWDRRSRRIYRVVLEAQRSALAAVKPGAKASDVDKAARDVIEAAGYGEAFGHSTGHGVGLEVHEMPTIAARSGEELAPGMVFTVEPGIYIEKFGGVRIEDMVLVTASGCKVISNRVPKILDP